jgi:hypothetical protein
MYILKCFMIDLANRGGNLEYFYFQTQIHPLSLEL